MKVFFPQAYTDFSPSLFAETEIWRGGSSSGYRHMKNAFRTLHATLCDLGVAIRDGKAADDDVEIRWSTKNPGKSPASKLFIEHGWLPRSSYQISPQGSNARSHAAALYASDPLSPAQAQSCRTLLGRLQEIFRAGVSADPDVDTPAEGYALLPLQLATDANLRDSNSEFAEYFSEDGSSNLDFARAVIARVAEMDIPMPVLVKQHPADRNEIGRRLELPDRRWKFLASTETVSTHSLFATARCKLVVGVNSNTLHEALVWNVPVIAMGTLLWDESRPERRPLASSAAQLDELLASPPLEQPAILAYLNHVLRHQWYLSDFQNPLMVRQLLDSGGRCTPAELRGSTDVVPRGGTCA